MSTVYNPEADTVAEIERLELEARDIRRRIDNARNREGKRVLDRQLQGDRAAGLSASPAAAVGGHRPTSQF